MSGIQRWECRVATNANGRPYVDDIEYAAGSYVLHSDHEAEVARLRAEVDAYKSLVRGIVDNRHKCFIPTDEPNSPTFNWDERADAAMGASA